MTLSQDDFCRALLDPNSPAPAGLRTPDGRRASKRFNIYRNNVAVSLTAALEIAFPVVRTLVGADFFRAMAGVFLRAHPPKSPMMMFYGAEMPDFLAGFGPAQSVPYLPDVARLELALRHSYHAADADPVSPGALGDLPPDLLPHVTFRFAPGVCVIPSRYPLRDIWWSNTHGGDVGRSAQAVLVARPEFDPTVDALTPDQARVTLALLAGQPLGRALQTGAAAVDLGPLLGLLLARNTVTAIQTERCSHD